MADKKKSGITILPIFVDGEQPTAYKFNTIGAQVKRSAYTLESSIGDIWDESYPYSTVSDTRLSSGWIASINLSPLVSNDVGRRLDMVSIGRLIGPASNLNPLTLGTGDVLAINPTIDGESVPSGVNQFTLRYPPSSLQNVVFSDATAFNQSNRQVSGAQVNSSGEWYIDNQGRVNSYDPTPTSLTVTYQTKPNSYGGGASYIGSTFNVIPDPNQVANGGAEQLVLTQVNQGEYMITLPICRDMQTNIRNNNTNLQTQLDINHAQQLRLPLAITQACGGAKDNSTEGTAGTVIPEGMIYLRNETTEEVYVDATYFYNTKSTLKIKVNDPLDLNDQFSLITVGTNITTSIMDLNRKQFLHSHSREFGEPLVSWEDLDDVFKYQGESGTWTPSENPTNKFPMYLHRDGSRSNGTDANDHNAMRGDLVLGRKFDGAGIEITDAGNYLGNGQSFKLVFGQNPLTSSALAQISKPSNDLFQILAGEADQSLQLLSDKDILLTAPRNLLAQSTVGNTVITAGGRMDFDAGTNLQMTADTGFLEIQALNGNMNIIAENNKSTWIQGGTIMSHRSSNVPKEPRDSLDFGSTPGWYHPAINMKAINGSEVNFAGYQDQELTIRPQRGNIQSNQYENNFIAKTFTLPSDCRDVMYYTVMISPDHNNNMTPNTNGLFPDYPLFQDEWVPLYSSHPYQGGLTVAAGTTRYYQPTGEILISIPLDLDYWLGAAGDVIMQANNLYEDPNGYWYGTLDVKILVWYRKVF